MPGIGDPYRGQLARPMQPRQTGCIAPIGLDPVTGPPRDQRRRHYDALVPARRQVTLDAVSARPCLVTEPKHYPATAELARQSIQCRRRVGDASVIPDLATQPAIGDRDNDPVLVNIKPDVGDTIPHDPSPMHEARRRPARRNPRCLHIVRRVAPFSGGHLV